METFISIMIHRCSNVLRDYGITAGNTNGNSWVRREIHVAQDGAHIKVTLWNEQVSLN